MCTVPPNPMDAYRTILACEFAAMLVQLVTAHGHINAMIQDFGLVEGVDPEWRSEMDELKILFNKFYHARGRSANYFQWMQTLICNLYSLQATAE